MYHTDFSASFSVCIACILLRYRRSSTLVEDHGSVVSTVNGARFYAFFN